MIARGGDGMARRSWGQVFRRPDSNRWYIKYPSGHRTAAGRTSYVVRAVGTEREAKAVLKEVRRRLLVGELDAPLHHRGSALDSTLAGAVAEFIKAGDRPDGTIKSYSRTLALLEQHPVGKCAVDRLDPREIEEWLQGLPVGAGTKKRHLAVVGGALHRLKKQGRIVDNPARRVTPPKLRQKPREVLRADEIRRLLRVLTGEMRVVFLVAIYTGARSGEVAGLRWCDVDLDDRWITIRRSKTRNASSIRLHKDVVAALEEYRRSLGRIPAPEDAIITIRNLWHAFRRILDSVEITRPGVTLHSTRHTFATHFVATGGSIRRLQQVLGHGTVSTTERYVRTLPHLGETEIDALHFSTPEAHHIPDGRQKVRQVSGLQPA
jgi:integrase